MSSRYRVNPNRIDGQRDLIDEVVSLNERVDQLQSSLQIGNTTIEQGSLIMRGGDIIMVDPANNDEVILRFINEPELPAMRFTPLGPTDTHQITLYGYDDPVADQAVQFVVEESSSEDADGGKLFLRRLDTVLSWHPFASGGEEIYIWLNFALNGSIAMRGRFLNKQNEAQSAFFTGQDSIGAGFGGATRTYSTAFANAPSPIVTILDSAGPTDVHWLLSSSTTSSFAVDWTGTAAKTIFYWVVR